MKYDLNKCPPGEHVLNLCMLHILRFLCARALRAFLLAHTAYPQDSLPRRCAHFRNLAYAWRILGAYGFFSARVSETWSILGAHGFRSQRAFPKSGVYLAYTWRIRFSATDPARTDYSHHCHLDRGHCHHDARVTQPTSLPSLLPWSVRSQP